MNRIKTIFTFVVFVCLLGIAFAGIASAQEHEKFSMTMDRGIQTVSRIFEDTPSGKFGDQRYKPAVTVITLRAQPTDRISGTFRWNMTGTLDGTESKAYGSNNFRDSGLDVLGSSTDLEVRGGIRILPTASITAGYARFGTSTMSFTIHDKVQYNGFLVGAESRWSNNIVGFSVDGGWYPRLTRTDSYIQRVEGMKFQGSSDTAASGMQAQARFQVKIWKMVEASVGYHFRQANTPHGNHLMQVIPDNDPERARWNMITFGGGFRF
jgi:hypothetical protein